MKVLSGCEFESVVKRDGVVVVDFSATWCGPCRMIAPFLDEISQEMPDIDIYKVDIDEAPEVASQYEVMSVPTLILFKNGEKISTCVGAASKARLTDWIKAHI